MPAPSTQPPKPPTAVHTPAKVKPEDVIVSSSPSKPLPSPSKVIFPALPPSTPVGNWILTGHSFAPQREYFMRFCAGLARRRVVDHLMWFRFPARGTLKRDMVPVHYSRLSWVGGPLAELIAEPALEKPHPEKKADPSSKPSEQPKANDAVDRDPTASAPDLPEKEKGAVEKADGEDKDTADKEMTDKEAADKEATDKEATDKENGEKENGEDAGKSKENGDAPGTDADADKPMAEGETAADEGKTTEKPADAAEKDKVTADPAKPAADAMDTEKPVEKDVQSSSDKPADKPVDKPNQVEKAVPVQIIEEDEDDEPFVRKEPFDLPASYTPRVFNIVAKFLYCEEICFNYLTFDEIVSLATAAHDYGLTDLYNATFAYVMDQNLLVGGLGIRTFTPLVNHEETPESFRRYFCIAVGHHFDVLYNRLKAEAATESSLVKTHRPVLWDVIISQRMLSHVIHCIRLYSKRSYDAYLLDVILRYYEPVDGKEDEDIIGLLSQLNWDNIEPNAIFHQDGPSTKWSRRGIRLAALASYSPQTESLEVRIPWNIPLQKLLKNDTWSFQTEHVFCGPYICYLHVRKGSGAEVSLFVHIWNRDGKPIGDDARHESVRVMCRATEINCKCDSGKQWSDTMHGFLENLKFEGKLERYPGLGWSQFLEARRLDEWRSSHGDECGLAITTVLQFVKPRRQFEGPARRSSVRSSSPSRLASPIQKKRPGLKMKLRESR